MEVVEGVMDMIAMVVVSKISNLPSIKSIHWSGGGEAVGGYADHRKDTEVQNKVLVAKKKRELEMTEQRQQAQRAQVTTPAAAGSRWQSLRAASASQASGSAWQQWSGRAQARSEKETPKEPLNPQTLDYNLVNVQKPEKREDASGQQGWGGQDVVTTKPFQDFIFVTEQQNQPNSVQSQVCGEEPQKDMFVHNISKKESHYHPKTFSGVQIPSTPRSPSFHQLAWKRIQPSQNHDATLKTATEHSRCDTSVFFFYPLVISHRPHLLLFLLESICFMLFVFSNVRFACLPYNYPY